MIADATPARDSRPSRRAECLIEKLGHALAIFVVTLHAQFKRLEPAEQQVNVLRAVDGSHDAAEIADRFQFLLGTSDDTGQQIVVAAQILGRRVQHVVDARIDRAQVVGRGQRGIDQRLDAGAVVRSRQTAPDRRTLRCGLVGDSLISIRVCGVMAASIAS